MPNEQEKQKLTYPMLYIALLCTSFLSNAIMKEVEYYPIFNIIKIGVLIPVAIEVATILEIKYNETKKLPIKTSLTIILLAIHNSINGLLLFKLFDDYVNH